MKIVINVCHGGFSLSKEAYEFLGMEWDGYGFSYKYNNTGRTDSSLVECVEKLGTRAAGSYADLKVVEIPDDVEWTIEEYDGCEWVAEKHRTWE